MNLDKLKQTAVDAIERDKESLFSLSRYINSNPETAFEEKLSSKAISGFLAEKGFDIFPGAGGLKTAFVADFGSTQAAGSAEVKTAIIAEYDALPGVGHGCGHNLIAAAAAAAGAGVAAALKEGPAGRVIRVIGTPAEEILTGTAGKNLLIEAGIFKNVGSALIFHPWSCTGVARKDLGCRSFRLVFSGRTAHAAADPWNGLNALDAAVIFYNSIAMLRQQLPSAMRVHCIMTEAGSVLNVIPDRAVVEVMLRSTELQDLVSFSKRIKDCAEAAGQASGCGIDLKMMASVKPIKFNQELFSLASANMEVSGEKLAALPVWQASSDFGDVSHEIPSLSLLYKTHDEDLCWHSRDVAKLSAGSEANEAMLRAAKILAMTAIDVLFAKNLLQS